ncbi:hypothetical protein Hanom_Chr05g00450691 [Helianthus anomalus]
MKVQYWKNTRIGGNGVEMTFLIQNLPDRVFNTLLWRAFQPHGFANDANVAKKKDARGNHFSLVFFFA